MVVATREVAGWAAGVTAAGAAASGWAGLEVLVAAGMYSPTAVGQVGLGDEAAQEVAMAMAALREATGAGPEGMGAAVAMAGRAAVVVEVAGAAGRRVVVAAAMEMEGRSKSEETVAVVASVEASAVVGWRAGTEAAWVGAVEVVHMVGVVAGTLAVV